MKFIAVFASLALGVSALAQSIDSAPCPVTFAYTGFARPDQWQHLPGSSLCGSGEEQSPVEFQPGDVIPGSGTIILDWGTVPIHVTNSGYDFRVVNADQTNKITIGGETYVLQNFHFHVPAEHSIPGSPAAAEVHFVHQNSDEEIAVIAVFFSSGSATTPIWQPVLAALPDDLCDVEETGNTFNLAALFGAPQRPRTLRQYDWYEGSLTTPKCDEDVRFYFLPMMFQLGGADARELAKFGENNRPFRPLNGRKLTRVRP
jgi:carbonic anhydrase